MKGVGELSGSVLGLPESLVPGWTCYVVAGIVLDTCVLCASQQYIIEAMILSLYMHIAQLRLHVRSCKHPIMIQ